ncbi:947_t:CDS:2, partial [Paraglomus occultum]
MVNANTKLYKKATTFEKCPSDIADPLTVTISPDPFVLGKPNAFTISGKLSADINNQTVVEISFGDKFESLLEPMTTSPACTQCPILAGSQFSMVATVNVPASSVPTKTASDYPTAATSGSEKIERS